MISGVSTRMPGKRADGLGIKLHGLVHRTLLKELGPSGFRAF